MHCFQNLHSYLSIARREKCKTSYQKIEQDADKHMANNIYKTNLPHRTFFVAPVKVLCYVLVVRSCTICEMIPIVQTFVEENIQTKSLYIVYIVSRGWYMYTCACEQGAEDFQRCLKIILSHTANGPWTQSVLNTVHGTPNTLGFT